MTAKRSLKVNLTFVLILLVTMFSLSVFTPMKTEAAQTGFVIKNGATYYINAKGKYQSGWLILGDKTYYFDTHDKKMVKGFRTIEKKKYYFSKTNGVMAKGLTKIGVDKYYFNKTTGVMKTGFVSSSNGQRYFDASGKEVFGWFENSKGQMRYFNLSTGYMKKGWMTFSNGKRFFNRSTGIMTVGKVTIDGASYTFSSNGILKSTNAKIPTGTKTIKNLLIAGLQPVGSTLYLYGGGHGADATRIGLNSAWKKSYKNGDFKSGLDCSGYVGWTVYQIMKKRSTDVSGTMPNMYKNYGWGTVKALSKVKTFLPGDIIAHKDHIWMVLGQCSDGSVVILHSTDEAGPQIAGTGGEAVKLAQKYMAKYSGYKKYRYSVYCANWLSKSNYYYSTTKVFRWNTTTLSDPNGYLKKTAAQILTNLSPIIGD